MILIVDMCYRKKSLSYYEFVRPIEDIVKDNFIVKHFSELKDFNFSNIDKIIFCGTALKDIEYTKHINLFEWLKNIDKPVLGICAGMQIISLVFGGELIKKTKIGMNKIAVVKDNKILTKKEFEAYELHNFSTNVPEKFEIIAKSNNSVEAIRYKNIYGVLFHPEVRNKEIIRNFIGL